MSTLGKSHPVRVRGGAPAQAREPQSRVPTITPFAAPIAVTSVDQLDHLFSQGIAALGLAISARQQQQLLAYLGLIAKWNKVYNLTAIRRQDEMLTHHLFDALSVIRPLQQWLAEAGAASNLTTSPSPPHPRSHPIRVLDVGSGAGLPGVVLAIVCESLSVVCVDAVGKKASFIQQVAVELGLKNLQGVHARVEALPSSVVSEGFDVITSRAFSSLGDLVSLTQQQLKASGVWMAMKAKLAPTEVGALPDAVEAFHVEHLTVPFLDEVRCLVWLRQKPK